MATITPRHFRIFLSSPGDVADERALTLQAIDNLAYDPALRGRMTLEAVAWDVKGAPPMEANLTPQQAIDKGLPLPSDCDIVVVIFWSRMGTPLEMHGESYRSGTEYEYRTAVEAGKLHGRPRVLLYRRTEVPTFAPTDPKFMEKYQQWTLVDEFFGAFRDAETGALKGGYNDYDTPDAFRELLEGHLKHIVLQLLAESTPDLSPSPTPATTEAEDVPAPPAQWVGSPFPGLRAFRKADAPIFYGRGRETDALTRVVNAAETRFLAVVGASGSGKSSLVGAGLIPRLLNTSAEDSWLIASFTPDELGVNNPFVAMAAALMRDWPGLNEPKLAARLKESPDLLTELTARVLGDKPEGARVLLFIDQFEEVFTTVEPDLRAPFIASIIRLTAYDRARIVVTLRGDFYGACLEVPELAVLLKGSTHPLGAPGLAALYEMITRPADRAGLHFEGDLADRILRDTGDEPGALALMAYTLDELYRANTGDDADNTAGVLTHAAYDALGGVQGAIGKRSEAVFEKLDADAQAALPRVFRELVEVDDRGTATRQRAALSRVADTEPALRLVNALTDARLLVQSAGEADRAYVEVAHEALLRNWTRLAEWIATTGDDLRLLREVRLAALAWDARGRRDDYLWSHERVEPVTAMQSRLFVTFDEITEAFLRPEAERLLDEFLRDEVPRHRKLTIIDRWVEIGESSVPMMVKALAKQVLHDSLSTQISSRVFPSRSGSPALGNLTKEVREALNPFRESAVFEILKAIEQEDAHGRAQMVQTLGLWFEIPKPKIEEMPEIIETPGPQTDFGYFLSDQPELPEITASEFGIIDRLLPLLSDESSDVRELTAKALGLLGDIMATIPLMACLNDDAISVLEAVVEALGRLHDVRAVPTLVEHLRPSKVDISPSYYRQQQYIIEALGCIRDQETAPTTVPLLRHVLISFQEEVDDEDDG